MLGGCCACTQPYRDSSVADIRLDLALVARDTRNRYWWRASMHEQVLSSVPRAVFGAHGAVSIYPACGRLLDRLSRTPGRCVTREQLISAIWPDPDDEPDGDTARHVGTLVCMLRRAMRQAGCQFAVATVWSEGYMVTEEPPTAIWLGRADAHLVARLLRTHPDQAAHRLAPVFDSGLAPVPLRDTTRAA